MGRFDSSKACNQGRNGRTMSPVNAIHIHEENDMQAIINTHTLTATLIAPGFCRAFQAFDVATLEQLATDEAFDHDDYDIEFVYTSER